VINEYDKRFTVYLPSTDARVIDVDVPSLGQKAHYGFGAKSPWVKAFCPLWAFCPRIVKNHHGLAAGCSSTVKISTYYS